MKIFGKSSILVTYCDLAIKIIRDGAKIENELFQIKILVSNFILF